VLTRGYLARPGPLGPGVLRPGPAAGLAELADDVVVVAAAEDARLVRLTIDVVVEQDGQLFIRLGDPPAPVPEPFAAMLTELGMPRQ
jgi:hypothetical protein